MGADDGIVSTASLLVGMAAANATPGAVLTAGLAGLVAGAASMAAGEYVSVSSQRDLEQAMLQRAREGIAAHPLTAIAELTSTLEGRGIDADLARRVAEETMSANPLGTWARIELGMSEETQARPLQAALASAGSFTVGAMIPLLGMLGRDPSERMALVVALAIGALAVCGMLGANAGGAPVVRAALRVVVGGGLAMLVSHGLGRLVGVVV
jgi:VIT1/CCC1 family predicted Fe2+/Mn2+ transporter